MTAMSAEAAQNPDKLTPDGFGRARTVTFRQPFNDLASLIAALHEAGAASETGADMIYPSSADGFLDEGEVQLVRVDSEDGDFVENVFIVGMD